MTPLCILADKYQTDKGGKSTVYGGCPGDTCHTYTKAYYELFRGRENEVKKVLEIGVNAGGSLRMWEEYFQNASIWGLDIRPEVMFKAGRITTIVADQSNAGSLLTALTATGPEDFDLIIDDGSHELHHQIISMRTLLPFLKPQGWYVIEDVGGMHCNPRPIQDCVPHGYTIRAIECPDGVGKAHCPACGGPEALFIIQR